MTLIEKQGDSEPGFKCWRADGGFLSDLPGANFPTIFTFGEKVGEKEIFYAAVMGVGRGKEKVHSHLRGLHIQPHDAEIHEYSFYDEHPGWYKTGNHVATNFHPHEYGGGKFIDGGGWYDFTSFLAKGIRDVIKKLDTDYAEVTDILPRIKHITDEISKTDDLHKDKKKSSVHDDKKALKTNKEIITEALDALEARWRIPMENRGKTYGYLEHLHKRMNYIYRSDELTPIQAKSFGYANIMIESAIESERSGKNDVKLVVVSNKLLNTIMPGSQVLGEFNKHCEKLDKDLNIRSDERFKNLERHIEALKDFSGKSYERY